MNLEIILKNYDELNKEAKKMFSCVYESLRKIHQIKIVWFRCKMLAIMAGLFIMPVVIPFLYSIHQGNLTIKYSILLGSAAIFYLIGWLIGLSIYHGDRGLNFHRNQFLYIYTNTEFMPLKLVLQVIQTSQPELITDTDRKIRKEILWLLEE